MSVFAEALDNIVKKEINHTGVNYIHTQKGSLVMNYRLIPPLGPCLLNLIALLKSTMDISHCIDCLSKQVKEDKRAFTMKKKSLFRERFIRHQTYECTHSSCSYCAYSDQLTFSHSWILIKQAHLHARAVRPAC